MGQYLVIEGDEGAGKTTQLELLKARLETEFGIQVVTVREPGGDPLAEQLRNLLKYAHVGGSAAAAAAIRNGETLPEITPMAEVALFSAARVNMLTTVIKPLLEKGVWVLADRSSTSTMIYQGEGRGLDSRTIAPAVATFADVCRPNLEFILNISLETSHHRLTKRAEGLDRIESSGEDFRAKINGAYRRLARVVAAVDGEGSVREVADRIWLLVTDWLTGCQLLDTPHHPIPTER